MILNRLNETHEATEGWIRQRREELAAQGLRPTDGTMEALSPKPVPGESLLEVEASGPLLNPRLLHPMPRLHPMQTGPVPRNEPSQE